MPALEKLPALLPEAEPFWQAYSILDGQRSRSEAGPNPIPLSEVAAFVQLSCITDQDEIDDLVRVIVRLDGMYMADDQKRRQKAAEDAKRKSRR